ncbi:rRNA-binding ribosome biosynthesis protein rpf2 [Dimargaris cristalligena]|uniref:Ribosome production factor 2 homolog n=1 Tax=Dimargaris cristalligena TaxID=215637 RepID=A0A4P9ZQS7_9FUNG|nr:rRNA-binding ribosome biosynthesis protein rpf2 [Dimargaris cristalligena]RKP35846.1 Brix domain-containing protein-like protein [Dimargaris cristalligena]|eukprot:RKP35846.1 Brix domain-containing protein-like protein [Dimargaris cristalligena]
MLRVVKPKNSRSKRFLDNREAKAVENVKTALVLRGSNTSEIVKEALADLYALKKPDAVSFSKKNEIHPFDDQAPLEALLRKNDTSLFLLGTHSKKRPHNLVFGRAFDHQILDMIEVGIEYAIPGYVFADAKCAVGARPLFLFQGEAFDQREEYRAFKNLLIDFFHGEFTDGIDLHGIQHMISVTAGPLPADESESGVIYFRVLSIELKKSGTKNPRVETTEMGPALDFRIRRTKLADMNTWRQATRVPREMHARNVKNINRDGMGDTYGRIHLGEQKLDEIQTRKMKALKLTRQEKKSQQNDAEGDDGSMNVE